MKKLFCSLIISCMALFVVWTIIAFINYGSDISLYHLNLQATFNKLNFIFGNINYGDEFISHFNSLKDNLEKINNSSVVATIMKTAIGGSNYTLGLEGIINVVSFLLDPLTSIVNSLMILVYVSILATDILVIFVNFTMGIYEFIFAPEFIHI